MREIQRSMYVLPGNDEKEIWDVFNDEKEIWDVFHRLFFLTCCNKLISFFVCLFIICFPPHRMI